MTMCILTPLVFIDLFPQPTAHQEPSTDELEAVARELATSKEGTGKHPTEESVRNGSYLRIVFCI